MVLRILEIHDSCSRHAHLKKNSYDGDSHLFLQYVVSKTYTFVHHLRFLSYKYSTVASLKK
ncbi:hypothetical protein ANAPC1_01271 [Anaplasma phagocytophilum]|uniref:Uncharacterized protein n=1 Tax=Anaplasma phagocytophilum TaxID=948 RepID=A0AA45UUU4_ANAPH|nr:hypothetical protein ANAPC1_01271 [Anaplasma phagocytophilum]